MPPAYQFYPPYPNPYMVVYPYNRTDFLGHPYKTYNENFPMNRTADLYGASPLFGNIPYGFEPPQFH